MGVIIIILRKKIIYSKPHLNNKVLSALRQGRINK